MEFPVLTVSVKTCLTEIAILKSALIGQNDPILTEVPLYVVPVSSERASLEKMEKIVRLNWTNAIPKNVQNGHDMVNVLFHAKVVNSLVDVYVTARRCSFFDLQVSRAPENA